MNTFHSFPKHHVYTWGLLISFCGQIGMLPPEAGMLALGWTVYSVLFNLPLHSRAIKLIDTLINLTNHRPCSNQRQIILYQLCLFHRLWIAERKSCCMFMSTRQARLKAEGVIRRVKIGGEGIEMRCGRGWAKGGEGALRRKEEEWTC